MVASVLSKDGNILKLIVIGVLICVLTGAVSFCVLTFSSFGSAEYSGIVYDEDLITFNREWKISAEGYGEYRPDELPFSVSLPSGTVITAENTFPASITAGTYLAFRSLYGTARVYVGNEIVGTSPVTERGNKTSPLPGWVFIPLSEEYSGRQLKLVMESSYRSFSGTVPYVLLGTYSEVLLYERDSCYFDIYVSVSVVVLGIVTMLFAALNLSQGKIKSGHLLQGLFITAIGVVLLSEVGMPHLSTQRYFLEYIAGHLIMVMLPLLYSVSMLMRVNGRGRRVFINLSAASVFSFLLCILAYFAGWIGLSTAEIIARMLLGAVLAASMVFSVIRLGEGSVYYKLLTGIGIAALAAAMALECIKRLSVYEAFIHLRYILYLVFTLTHAVSIVFVYYEEATGNALLSKELAESRMRLMISQMQPHFVQNTLTTIRAMIPTDPEKAYDMIYDFAGYLRFNIDSLSNIPIIPFEEELKHIKIYTDIESLRFEDRVRVVYEISDMSFSVPPLSVQPFVENAIKHGVCRKKEGGSVFVRSFLSGGDHIVCVEDNGAGFDTAILDDASAKGIGIKNAAYRLENQIGAKVDIKSVLGEGTRVTLTIPGERRSENENDLS